MKPKTFLCVAAAAAISFSAALMVYAANAPVTGVQGSITKLLPNLATEAGKTARIEILQGTDKLTLEKQGDKWVIASRDGYPASTERVRALVAGLTDAHLLEAKTRNAERLKVLSLEEPDAKTANSRLVRLLDDKGTVLGEVIAGKSRSDAGGASASGTYVRKTR